MARPDDAATIVEIFKKYMKAEGNKVGRKDFEENLDNKMKHPGFSSDLKPLLSSNVNYDDKEAFELVQNAFRKRKNKLNRIPLSQRNW